MKGHARTDQSEVRLDPPEIVPDNMAVIDPSGMAVNRTNRTPLAPDTETRVLFADREHVSFLPGDFDYASTDRQKGGAPGAPGSIITSQDIEGNTRVGAAPRSPMKFTFGMADWSYTSPQPLPAHGKIQRRSNPNNAITTIGIWANEGTPSNTNYEQAAPWAAGIYIG